MGKGARRRARRANRQLRTKRERVYIRRFGRCHYCGCGLTMQTMTIDHVIPKSKVGSSAITNLVAACLTCNQEKGDALPWWMKGAA